MSEKDGNNSYQSLQDNLKNLEARIARLEAHLKLDSTTKTPPPLFDDPFHTTENTAKDLEFEIGQSWFARIGIVMLAIGVIFLLTFQYKSLPVYLPSLIGYILVGFLFLISRLVKRSFDLVSNYLFGGGLLLFYFSTLRFNFFSIKDAIPNTGIFIALLIFVNVLTLWASFKRQSIYLFSMNFATFYLTALICGDFPYILFSLLLLLSAGAVFIVRQYNWNFIFFQAIVLTFLAHLLWFINNPVLGNQLELATSPLVNLFFILAYTLVFACSNFIVEKDFEEKKPDIVTFSTLFLTAGGYGLYLLETLASFKDHFTILQIIASVIFIALSILFWLRFSSKHSTFYYAMTGYIALSVAIISFFDKPDYFVYLSWQSLLVIVTALWFRSKVIILANFLIFIIIFVFYLVLVGKMSTISLSFGIVAILSARIMNWQKHRLQLKTEFMRNSYLVTAFFIFPYALYHAVPKSYVVLSWVIVTVIYFIFSIILKNKKYRWMGIFTLVLTVGYLFVVGIPKMDPVLRIVSFFVLGLVLLTISLIYTKIKSKTNIVDENNNPQSTN